MIRQLLSVLDHIYIKDPTIIKNIKALTPIFGDHLLIIFNVDSQKPCINMLFTCLKAHWTRHLNNGGTEYQTRISSLFKWIGYLHNCYSNPHCIKKIFFHNIYFDLKFMETWDYCSTMLWQIIRLFFFEFISNLDCFRVNYVYFPNHIDIQSNLVFIEIIYLRLSRSKGHNFWKETLIVIYHFW